MTDDSPRHGHTVSADPVATLLAYLRDPDAAPQRSDP